MSSSRIACLRVPLFPLAARLRSEPELTQQALAVFAGNGATARVAAATRDARRAGIRPGLTLSQARARLPGLIARARDPECERAAQQALLDIAESFSPRVEDPGEGLAYLDITGLNRHYPGDTPEHDLGRALILALERRASLLARVGVAASKLAARVAAGQPQSPVVIPGGEEASFLAPLPLTRLTPQATLLSTLQSWGIRSVGDLAGLPKDQVASRLGSGGQELHAIARGLDPNPLVPRQPPRVLCEGLELEWPLVQAEPFLFVARAALERLSERLRASALACQRLELVCQLDPEGHHQRSIALPAPTREVKTLLTLLRLDLDAHPPPAPIVAFSLNAHPDSPRRAQLNLFGPPALSPERLGSTLARLFALLGDGRAGSPTTHDSHCPTGFSLVPFDPPPPPDRERSPRAGRGLLMVRALRPAVELEVLVHGGSPQAAGRPLKLEAITVEEGVRRPRIVGAVRVASGPWALEEGWWSEEPVERDYWDVELATGGLYRIFRDRSTGDWFADGVYD